MAHIAVISAPVHSHLSLFIALGLELQGRGHRVSFVHMPDVGTRVREAGMEFVSIGNRDHPQGTLPADVARLGQLEGLAALRFTVKAIGRTTNMLCRDAPDALRALAPDLLLVDQTEPAGGSLADYLGLPFVTACNALALNREPDVPPPFTPWRYQPSPVARVRNRIGYAVADIVMRPVLKVLHEYRRHWHLPPLASSDDSNSRLAQIAQQPRTFDFPRRQLPEWFHYVGPLRRGTSPVASFPWDRLDGRPLIYASMGTLVNRSMDVFDCIGQACESLDAQLLVTTSGGLDPANVQPLLPRRALVVAQAPQMEVLQRASLTISHGGLNTTLDSLSRGVPLVVIPNTSDQPGVGARVEYTGTGVVVSRARLNSRRLRLAIHEVLGNERYAREAERLRQSIASAGGITRAGDIVEAALATCRPVLAPHGAANQAGEYGAKTL